MTNPLQIEVAAMNRRPSAVGCSETLSTSSFAPRLNRLDRGSGQRLRERVLLGDLAQGRDALARADFLENVAHHAIDGDVLWHHSFQNRILRRGSECDDRCLD